MDLAPGLRVWTRVAPAARPLGSLAVVAGFVLWSHFGSGIPVFRSHIPSEPGWEEFGVHYRVKDFGEDGHFARSVQNGYNLFFFTYKYAWRFTRKTLADAQNTCASCHTPEDMAYSFVSSDRFDAALQKRVSFEERIMRCFARHMDGFVPTLYDPTVRDLRILAREVAHHLQLSEGALRNGN